MGRQCDKAALPVGVGHRASRQRFCCELAQSHTGNTQLWVVVVYCQCGSTLWWLVVIAPLGHHGEPQFVCLPEVSRHTPRSTESSWQGWPSPAAHACITWGSRQQHPSRTLLPPSPLPLHPADQASRVHGATWRVGDCALHSHNRRLLVPMSRGFASKAAKQAGRQARLEEGQAGWVSAAGWGRGQLRVGGCKQGQNSRWQAQTTKGGGFMLLDHLVMTVHS